jgi:endonuclease-3
MLASEPKHLKKIDAILSKRFHDFAHYNITTDPLEELLFIICTTKTTEAKYRVVYSGLRAEFPTNASILRAHVARLKATIRSGGLGQKKALAIKGIMAKTQRLFGTPTLEPLRHLPDDECEAFLTSLPGVGKKVARCVMLYALRRNVFPVDEHCWRVSKRLGWIRQTRRNRSGSPRDEDRLQDKIPPENRYSLHVNFISLGRNICLARHPRCDECPIRQFCPKIGINRRALTADSAI